MAHGLNISPSYLNLIERNQRPITVQLILKFSKIYNISPEDLEGDSDGIVTALKEVFQIHYYKVNYLDMKSYLKSQMLLQT